MKRALYTVLAIMVALIGCIAGCSGHADMSATDAEDSSSGIVAESTETALVETTETTTTPTTQVEATQVEATQVEATEDTAQFDTAAPEPTIDPQSTMNPDLEIVTREGHPADYGSMELAHEVWDDVPEGKVLFGDEFDNYTHETVLGVDCYRGEDLIREIDIHFENFEEPVGVSIEDALKIAASYLPFEVMDEYYEYGESKLYVPVARYQDYRYSKLDNDYGPAEPYKRYCITYRLTDAGSEAYYAKKHSYSGTIDIVISTDNDDIAKEILIRFGLPRIGSRGSHDYDVIDWECDLYGYRQDGP